MSELPTAVESERAVLASVLYDQRGFTQVRASLADDEWYLEQHRHIWSAICELAPFGAVDFIAVHESLTSQHPRSLQALTALSGYTITGSLEWHCDRIRDTAAARALIETGKRLLQKSETSEDPVALAEETIDALRIIQRANGSEESSVKDFHDIVSRAFDPAEFVVPGLLARGNRIIITSPEGYGKSSLLRQIAACGSAGVHPFNPRGVCRKVRAFVVDAENPAEINTAEYQRVYDGLAELNALPERGMLTIDECGPINLLDGRQAARLYALVEKLQPELLIIGPIYQLHEEDPNDERPARKLVAVLDRLRRISNAALVTEAHTPHSDGPHGQLLRPYGASLWKRWPEFGYCLHPVTVLRANETPTEEQRLSLQMRESKFTPWRGQRAARNWPERLCFGAPLPWGTY
jgi:replicative DNA helicase